MCNEKESNSQPMTLPKLVGFEARNKEFLSSYLCLNCNLLLRNPCQLNCGHRFCRSCLDAEIKSTIKCNKCDEETLANEVILDKGCTNDMKKLDISCFLCQWMGTFENYQEHLEESHSNIKCDDCENVFESTNNFIQHTFVCDKIFIHCELESYGCSRKFLRIHKNEHYLSVEHQNRLLQLVKGTTSIKRTTLEELAKPIEELAGSVQVLTDETLQMSTMAIQQEKAIENLSANLSKVKEAIEETNSYFNAQKTSQDMIEQEIISLREKIDDMINASFDGTMLWKITDVRKRLADSLNDQQPSLYSPVFYSSPNGYKMRMRLYLGGDGNARRTHMSAFFVLMRGDYDALLEFPFKYKITFCLFDQTSQQRHIIDSFRPDIKSNSFQRPRSDMNVASGLPKFVPLTMIQQDNSPYVRDDTMLIKIIVDFGNIPKTVLPYAIKLNPALPLLVQRDLIKQELIKQENTTTTTTSSS